MNLLVDGVQSGLVIKTNISKKLRIDGITEIYPVYKVRLDLLYFNDQNDRIATWISEFKNSSNDTTLDFTDREAYNSVIEEFVVKSNLEATKKTQTSIELTDQREPGVALSDGRVIDGNRRFACLRRLSQKNERFNYLEIIILDRNIEKNAKMIKMLELSIQHGEESKIDYNPIDRLVGIYNDVIKTKLLSPAEYALSANESEQEVNRRIDIAKLMVDFLDFINAPMQFHVARDMQVYSPIEALLPLLKKCRSEDEREDLKISVFTNLLMRSEGDMRLFVRSLKNIVGSDYQEEFIEEQKQIAEKVIDALPPEGQVTEKLIRDSIRANDGIVQELSGSLEKTMLKVKKTETRNRPIQLVEKATDFLESIDMNILKKLNDSDIQRLIRQLNRLESVAGEIRNNVIE